jgi:hypothetical protein
MLGEGSAALERYRDERAKIVKMERLAKEGNLIPLAEVQETLSRMAGLLRCAGEKLQTQFGKEAAEIHDDAIYTLGVELGIDTETLDNAKPNR